MGTQKQWNEQPPRGGYPSDVSDEEWALVVPYLTLMDEQAPQRDYGLRDIFNALLWIARSGAPWRFMPHEMPPWHAVYQQTRRWLAAGVFEQIVHDLRMLLRLAEKRHPNPTAAIIDSDHRFANIAVNTRERRSCRLRRCQAAQGIEGTHGSRHAGASVSAARDSSQ
jgi:transposase